jgi:hypothetical protein
MTAQQLAVHVPFSDTSLQMGTSVGGPGASLTTAGDVLLDSVGVMDIQSKSTFMAQTAATLSMLSASVQKIHSQGKVELYAGGGKAPAQCGLSSPTAPVDAGPPGATMEKITGVACAALGVTSASFGIKDAWAAGAITGKVIAGAVMGVAALGAGKAVAAAAGAGGGGGADIEERASAGIKMVAGKKISGLAPKMIGSQTPGKFEVKALLVTDFTTVLFTNFALAKFEVKALDAFKTTSLTFELEGDASTEISTKDFKGKAARIHMNGATTVTKQVEVKGKTYLRREFKVREAATMTGELLVKEKTAVKGNLTVKKDVTISGDLTLERNLKAKQVEWKSRVTFGV